MTDTVIKIENLSKQYHLGEISTGTLSHDLNRWCSKVLGKKDPYSKIGENDMETDNSIPEKIWALKDFNLEIKRGQVLGIIGRNGAGKSTLLKLISRITAPTTGTIRVKGRIASLLEVSTGMHMEMTARENIYLNGAILGMKQREITKKFDEIIDFAGIDKFIDTPVKRFSSGMKTRLGFAVAAHLEPEILVVDEVLAVGDIEFQRKCIKKMDDASYKGRTVLFVSHNMAIIRQLCPATIWLSKGIIKDQGETDRVVAAYTADSVTDPSAPIKAIKEDPGKSSQLIQFRMLDHAGNESEVFECDYSITLELLFLVRKKLWGLVGYLVIYQMDRTVVFTSDSFDFGYGANTLSNLEKGKFIISITIPARTLAPGDYSVYLNFANQQGNSTDSPGIVGQFALNDGVSPRGNKRHGFFSTLLNWDVKKISDS